MDITQRVSSRTKAITRLELFRMQVADIYERMRADNGGKSHLPAQLGGTYGQRELLKEKNVLDVTEIST